MPSPPTLITRPPPRPERHIEVFQSKVTKAAEMLQKLDSEATSSSKGKKPPTRDWIAQIREELVQRSKSSAQLSQRPYEPPPPAPSPTYKKQISKEEPMDFGGCIHREFRRQSIDEEPKNDSSLNYRKMNPLTVSQSESHIQSRPECSRCHAPINTIWERLLLLIINIKLTLMSTIFVSIFRIVIEGLMLHRSCLFCSGIYYQQIKLLKFLKFFLICFSSLSCSTSHFRVNQHEKFHLRCLFSKQ